MKYTVKLEPIGISRSVNAGTPLRDIVHEFGIEFPCAGQGICGNCKVKLLQGDIEITEIHRKALEHKKLDHQWRLACLSRVTENITIHISQYENIILADTTRFEFIPQTGYGVAVDLGSTTIVSQLLDLTTGEIVGVETGINPQTMYGADIISRISFALESETNMKKLSDLIRNFIGNQIKNLTRLHPVQIKKINIVGNTVMHHLFCRKNVAPLSVYPFISPDNQEFTFQPKELDWDMPQETLIRFLPNIGGFVGSDILAGIRATGMYKKEKHQILIDLGTNGEIAVGNHKKILCASTAAGPAFEGTNITQGMRATTGAIARVRLENQNIIADIIGHEKAQGICGSGLIDAIAVFLQTGKIDFTGNICTDEDFLPVSGNIGLSARDIREFQLAKAAISAGVQLLMEQLDIKAGDIEHVFIAGGFGNYININNAISLGLLEFKKEQIIRLSNSALTGAKMSLFESADDQKEVLSRIEHLPLETTPGFQDAYCEKMFFTSYI